MKKNSTKMKFLNFLALSVFLLFTACESGTGSSEQMESDSTENARSISEMSGEPSEMGEDAQPKTIDQLMGTWKLIERKMGPQTLAMADDEESLLEFKQDGTLVSTTDGFEPATFDFSVSEMTLSADLWDNPQQIKSIDGSTLILVDKVDGVDIDYLYEKVK